MAKKKAETPTTENKDSAGAETKKTTAKKTPAKKAATPKKPATPKTTAKKAATPKTPATPKTTAKKAATPKKPTTRKTTAKKAATPKTPVSQKVETRNYPKIADTRLAQLRYMIEDLKVDAIFVNYLPNISYLTSFSGTSAYMLITPEVLHFFTDDRYAEQIKTELYPLPNLITHITRDVWQTIEDENLLTKFDSIAFESDRMSYDEAVKIRNRIRPVKFKPQAEIVEPFTRPKSIDEYEYIQTATKIAEDVYEAILPEIKPGITELDLAIEMSYRCRKLGSEGDPFPFIVVSGTRGALVHGKPSEKKIENGDLVILDFGATVHGFLVDITRTVAVGKATKEQQKIYEVIIEAKESAFTRVLPGMQGKYLDQKSREIIEKAGYGDYFKHSLGRGIGLVRNEKPIITFRLEDQLIPEKAVLAIEPGIYVPDKFGIRVQDNLYVTRSGGEHVSKAPDKLPVL